MSLSCSRSQRPRTKPVTPLRYPVATLCHGGPLHMLQQFIGGVDVGVSQLRPLDVGLDGSSVGRTARPTLSLCSDKEGQCLLPYLQLASNKTN